MARFVSAVVSSVLFLIVGIVGAAEKRPLSLDDLYRQEEVANFTISPRGDEAVYVRTWYDVNLPGKRTALWRIDGETGRHAPLEAGEPDGRMPAYSPDGRWLAFVTGRVDEHANRYGLAAPVPSYSDPTGSIRIIPRVDHPLAETNIVYGQAFTDNFYGRLSFAPKDSQLLFVLGRTPPRMEHGLPGDLIVDDQGEGYEGYGWSSISFWTDSEFNGRPVSGLSHSGTIVEPGRWLGDPQWFPDCKSVVFHANLSDDQESVRYSINKDYDLWRADVTRSENGERLLRLTSNPGPDVSPRISPNGKHVLYLSVPRKGPHMDVFNLCVLPLDEENAEPQIIVNAHDAERAADGTPPFQPTFPLRDDAWIDDEHVRVRGVVGMRSETRVFNIAGPDAPIAATAKPEPAPHANEKLKAPPVNEWKKERYEAREEIVRWKSFDGLEIEGILTLPPAELTEFKAPYPVIVHPHGGPHSASKPGFNFNVHLFAAHGYAVFQPNFRGSYGYGRKFLDAARFDMGGSDMQDILTGIDMLIERGTVDADRQFVYGVSYGGYSTCRLIGLVPDRFQAACAVNAVTDLHAMWSLSDLQSWTEWEFGGKPWETVEHDGKQVDVGALMRDRSPTTHAHKVTTPTLILHSDHDRRCPLPMGQMFYRCLKENDCETELVIYQDERHGFWQMKHQADAVRRVLEWFAKHDNSSP